MNDSFYPLLNTWTILSTIVVVVVSRFYEIVVAVLQILSAKKDMNYPSHSTCYESNGRCYKPRRTENKDIQNFSA